MSERGRLEDLARQRGPSGALEVAADDLDKCRASVEVLRDWLGWALCYVRFPDGGNLEEWARAYNMARELARDYDAPENVETPLGQELEGE